MISRETAIEMAKEAGGGLESEYTNISAIQRLVNAAYAKGLEDAAALVQANAEACNDQSIAQVYLSSNAHAIRAMKEQQ